MNGKKCVFCNVINKEIPSEIIDETSDLIVIKDIYPKAPIHYLIIPKEHIRDLRELNNRNLASNILFMAKKLGDRLPEPKSFRLIASNGYESGQRIFHLHFHFLSGKKMTEL